jgi:hypothetical protein
LNNGSIHHWKLIKVGELTQQLRVASKGKFIKIKNAYTGETFG